VKGKKQKRHFPERTGRVDAPKHAQGDLFAEQWVLQPVRRGSSETRQKGEESEEVGKKGEGFGQNSSRCAEARFSLSREGMIGSRGSGTRWCKTKGKKF